VLPQQIFSQIGSRLVEEIGKLLRQGKSGEALQLAQQLCQQHDGSKEIGISIAREVAAVYRDLITPPVHEFAEAAETQLPAPAGALIAKALQRLINITKQWESRLWTVHTERLAREIRDWTRMRHLDAAAANIARMMALVDEKQRPRRAKYIGNILATVINNQKEAQQLVGIIARNCGNYFFTRDDVLAMENARIEHGKHLLATNLENLDREYSTIFIDAVVELQRTLPEKMEAGDPSADHLREAGDAFRSVLRVPIWRGETDLLLDATNLLVDFVPKNQSETARMARIEERAYNTLGMTAKKAVVLTFQDIGRNSFFNHIYQKWAEDFKETEFLGKIIELMGALRTNDYHDFLKALSENSRVGSAVSAQLSNAYGSIAGGDAADSLLASLKSILGKRSIGSAEITEGNRLVSSLGILVKSPRTSSEDRNMIREYLRNNIPEDISKLACHTAIHVFTYKANDLTPVQRQWVIRILARGLWRSDDSTEHHKGQEKQSSELGFREPIVQALEKVVGTETQTLIKAMEPMVARYGAGYWAAAEFLTRLSREATLQILAPMLSYTLRYDENAQTSYQQEFYWDAASQERKLLTKEKILNSLIFAVGSIGGDEAKKILLNYKEEIAIGRVSSPSAETAQFMERFLGNQAFSAPLESEADENAGSTVAASLTPAQINGYIKQLNARYLLSGKQKRRMKKIEALTFLGMSTPLEALDHVFKHLGEKDSMIASAVITCLSEFASPKKSKQMVDMTVNITLDHIDHKDPLIRAEAIKLLKEIGPSRKDVKGKVLAFTKHIERQEVKDALLRALRTKVGNETLNKLVSGMKMDNPVGPGSKDEADKIPASSVDRLEIKRQYMNARRGWIDGGKVGDPPPRPPGMD
jgi:hypothetical protein